MLINIRAREDKKMRLLVFSCLVSLSIGQVTYNPVLPLGYYPYAHGVANTLPATSVFNLPATLTARDAAAWQAGTAAAQNALNVVSGTSEYKADKDGDKALENALDDAAKAAENSAATVFTLSSGSSAKDAAAWQAAILAAQNARNIAALASGNTAGMAAAENARQVAALTAGSTAAAHQVAPLAAGSTAAAAHFGSLQYVPYGLNLQNHAAPLQWTSLPVVTGYIPGNGLPAVSGYIPGNSLPVVTGTLPAEAGLGLRMPRQACYPWTQPPCM